LYKYPKYDSETWLTTIQFNKTTILTDGGNMDWKGKREEEEKKKRRSCSKIIDATFATRTVSYHMIV